MRVDSANLDVPERSEGSFASPPPDSRRAGGPERSGGHPVPAGNEEGACYPQRETPTVEQAAHLIIHDRLRLAGEFVYARGRADHPVFKSAGLAASNLLGLLPANAVLLVMRDRVLRPLRELLLEQDRPLLVTNKAGTCVYSVPRSALFDTNGRRATSALRVDPLPRGSAPYAGLVDAVVVGCLAFDPQCRRLYSFDCDRTAAVLDELRQGVASGFRLAACTPVLALAHDAQRVDGWPNSALGFVAADAVVTPTRLVMLEAGATMPIRSTQEASNAL